MAHLLLINRLLLRIQLFLRVYQLRQQTSWKCANASGFPWKFKKFRYGLQHRYSGCPRVKSTKIWNYSTVFSPSGTTQHSSLDPSLIKHTPNSINLCDFNPYSQPWDLLQHRNTFQRRYFGFDHRQRSSFPQWWLYYENYLHYWKLKPTWRLPLWHKWLLLINNQNSYHKQKEYIGACKGATKDINETKTENLIN